MATSVSRGGVSRDWKMRIGRCRDIKLCRPDVDARMAGNVLSTFSTGPPQPSVRTRASSSHLFLMVLFARMRASLNGSVICDAPVGGRDCHFLYSFSQAFNASKSRRLSWYFIGSADAMAAEVNDDVVAMIPAVAFSR